MMIKKLLTKLFKLFGIYKNREIVSNTSTTTVVITGVETSPIWGSCTGASKDCDTFKDIVSKSADNYDVIVLKNNMATADKWKKTLEEAVKKPLAIIFYSGHGGSDSTHVLSDGTGEEDGIDEYLCLYDKPVVDNDIWNIISKSKGRVVLIFDCCHSGTMFRTANGPIKQEEEKPLEFDFNKFIMTDKDGNTQKDNQPSILCWSACADNTVAKGSVFGGVFTNMLSKKFGTGDTYKSLWNKLSSERSLSRIEAIQIHEVGESFKDELFCR